MNAYKAFTGMLRDSHLCGLGEGQDMLSGTLEFPWHGVLPKGASSPLHQPAHILLLELLTLDGSCTPLQLPKVTLKAIQSKHHTSSTA